MIAFPSHIAFAPDLTVSLAALHRRLEAGARALVGDHIAEALGGFARQPFADLREGAGAGDGGLGLELGRLHDFLADGLLVGLVGQCGLGDFAAQAHGALTRLAHDVLLRLEEPAQGGALVIVQIAEEFLRVELLAAKGWIDRSALAFAGAEVPSRPVHWATFAPGRGVAAHLAIASDAFSGPGILAAALIGAELATWRALAFSGSFLAGTVVAGTVVAGTLLAGAFLRRRDIGERDSAQRSKQRAGEAG